MTAPQFESNLMIGFDARYWPWESVDLSQHCHSNASSSSLCGAGESRESIAAIVMQLKSFSTIPGGFQLYLTDRCTQFSHLVMPTLTFQRELIQVMDAGFEPPAWPVSILCPAFTQQALSRLRREAYSA